MIPGFTASSSLLMVMINFMLAQLLAVRSGWARRPTPEFHRLELPGWLWPGIGVAALLVLLGGILGEQTPVKSHHHQAVDRVAEPFMVTGWSDGDDLPEAMEASGARYALGVQWHPEADERSRLVASLVEEVRARG